MEWACFFLSISLMIMKTYRLFTLKDNTELHSWPRLQCTYHSHSLIGRYRILITDKFLGILRPFLYAPSHINPIFCPNVLWSLNQLLLYSLFVNSFSKQDSARLDTATAEWLLTDFMNGMGLLQHFGCNYQFQS